MPPPRIGPGHQKVRSMIDEMNSSAAVSAAPAAETSRRARRDRFAVEARELLILSGPLIVTQLAQMAILATDTVLLGRLSTEALAAAPAGW